MVLFPDLSILQTFILGHPLAYGIFFLLQAVIAGFFLLFIKRHVPASVSRIVYFLIILFAVFHFFLISLLLFVLEVISLFSKGEARSRAVLNIVAVTSAVLAIFAVLWVGYIHILDPGYSVGAAIKKLLNYPKIFEKVISPVVYYNVWPELALAAVGGVVLLLLARERQLVLGTSFCIALLLLSVSGTGIAETFYSHVRYIYYLCPLLLGLIAAAIVLLWDRFAQRLLAVRLLLIAVVAAGAGFQGYITWTKVVQARPGSTELYSYAREYFDFKTCCEYLTREKSGADYVVAFTSAHQSAVYCGKIDACLRPATREHQGVQHHYITGSIFFDTPGDLMGIVSRNVPDRATVWVLYSESFRKPDWGARLTADLAAAVVCTAEDDDTKLVRITKEDFLRLLDAQRR